MAVSEPSHTLPPEILPAVANRALLLDRGPAHDEAFEAMIDGMVDQDWPCHRCLSFSHNTELICFTSRHRCCFWTLVTVYGPCRGIERDNFFQWLHDLVIPFHENWLLVGDFSFMRSVDNRNKPGADMNVIFIFNEIISYLGLVELPLKGRSFTWYNMQKDPLLIQLDWLFTSYQWTLHFPNTLVHPLAKNASHHVPCVIILSTSIPRAHIFRFENHWIQQPGFLSKWTGFGKFQ
jgi:hypothetical protein